MGDRREASHAAHALGIALGSRILRAHDVRGARRTADVMAAVLGGSSRARRVSSIPVTLLRGDDEVVLRDAVRLLVDDLVGDEDRSLMVEEVDVGAATDDGDPLLALVDAAQTPPFLTEHRVVLGRMTEKRERNDLVQPLVDYLVDPLPSTLLVLEWRAGSVPKALLEAVVRVGGAQVDTSPGRKVSEWVAEHLAEAGLKVDRRAGTGS